MELHGSYFDGRTSKGHDAELRSKGDAVEVWLGSERVSTHPSSSLDVYPQLGSLPGRVLFPDGGCFETGESLSFLDQSRMGWMHSRIASIERNWKLVAASVAGLAIFLVLTFEVFLPASAPVVARHVPAAVVNLIERKQMDLLERFGAFKPSRLSPKETGPLERVFEEVRSELPELNLRLRIVHAKEIGANAFALPAGQIVVTDEFITRVKDPEQMRAVLYHEAGHVHHLHTIQSLIKNSALALTASVFLGDAAGAGLLVALATSRYSRGMETEADRFAIDRLLVHHRDPQLLGEALRAIQKEQPPTDAGVLKYLSSHPPTAERIETFKKAMETTR